VSQKQKTNQPMGWAIALHGGAGVPYSLPPELRQPREEALHHCLQIGIKALNSKMTPLDVVELVVCICIMYSSITHFYNIFFFCFEFYSHFS
jgi:hypothetical protein